MDYSVLMSTYAGENPDFLRQGMASIFAQTLPTNDFVLVCDGSLTLPLDKVVNYFARENASTLRVVRIPENLGLAAALNVGLSHCANEIVARMDSDDIAHPERMERQLSAMDGVDVLGSAVLEFSQQPEDAKTMRRTPPDQHSIINFARRRNPFNHPSVMYRKSAVMEVGGYEQFPLCEDYQLWVKMLMGGFVAKNLSEPLLYMRVGNGMHKRRGGIRYFKTMINFRRWMKSVGFSGNLDFCSSVISHGISCFVPNLLRKNLYGNLLRERVIRGEV